MTQTIIYLILALCVLGLLAIGVLALVERRKEQNTHAYRPARSGRRRPRRSTHGQN